MVAVFAGLKWHLLLGRLRAVQKSRRPWLLLGFVVVLALVGFIAFGITTSRPYPETARVVAILMMTLQLISWVVAPLVAFGLDETVDPHRFALLPLRRGTLIRGLTVTSLIGWLPLVNLIWLLAIAVALSTSWSMLPLAVVCVLVQLLLCVVVSRAASTAMASLMNSRRGRDLGMLVGFGLFVLYMLASSLLGRSEGEGFYDGLVKVTHTLGWFPPGALARIPGLVDEGDWAQAAVAVLIVLAGLGLALFWWMKALTRTLESGSSMTESSSPSSSSAEFGALGRRATNVAGVVAARDVLLIWRDPMRRISWLVSIAMAFGWPFLVIQSGHGALFAVAFGGLMMGLQAANQLALDGSGLWLHLVMSGDRSKYRDEIRGHAVVALIPGVVVVVLATLFFAVIRSDLDLLPGALGINLGAMLGSAGFACWLSAALPYGVPQSRSSMFASAAPGQKGRSGGASLAVMGGGIAVALPAAALTLVGHYQGAVWGWAALVVGVVLGLVILQRLIEIGADKYYESGPEILHQVSAGDRV
ncbi:hypothetical protein D1871_17105 [Nakamurella silvestris]|nr:hypothetical protein D1871_17105 [Nakamurella silvestris]